MRIHLWNIYCLGNVRERVIVGDFFSCLSRLRDLVDLTTFLTAFCKMLTLEPNVKNTLWWQILYDGFLHNLRGFICMQSDKRMWFSDFVLPFIASPGEQKGIIICQKSLQNALNKHWGLILTHSLTCKIIFNGGCRPIFHIFGF